MDTAENGTKAQLRHLQERLDVMRTDNTREHEKLWKKIESFDAKVESKISNFAGSIRNDLASVRSEVADGRKAAADEAKELRDRTDRPPSWYSLLFTAVVAVMGTIVGFLVKLAL